MLLPGFRSQWHWQCNAGGFGCPPPHPAFHCLDFGPCGPVYAMRDGRTTGWFSRRTQCHRAHFEHQNYLQKIHTCNINKISTMSSLTSRSHLTGHGVLVCGRDHVEVQHQCQHCSSSRTSCRLATSAAFVNGTLRKWFRTTLGVRQGCLVSPTLFDVCFWRGS